MELIAYFKKDNSALSKQDKYLVTPRGQRRMWKTTKGWKLLVIWKDQLKTWIPLKDLKESNPVEVAEFAKSRFIEDEPAFCWWVPYVVKSRVRKTTHKYGTEIPKSRVEAFRLDNKNVNSFCLDAI